MIGFWLLKAIEMDERRTDETERALCTLGPGPC